MNVGVRFVVEGLEVSLSSFADTIVREIRTCVREEIGRTLSGQATKSPEFFARANSQMPRQAVSIREVARLLSISPRTVHKYVALKVIPTIRIGRRVLIPIKGVNDLATRGIPSRPGEKPRG